MTFSVVIMLMESRVKLRSQQNIVGTSKNKTRMQEMAPNGSSCIIQVFGRPKIQKWFEEKLFLTIFKPNLPKVFDLKLDHMLRVKITYLLNQLGISGLLETLDLRDIFMFFIWVSLFSRMLLLWTTKKLHLTFCQHGGRR